MKTEILNRMHTAKIVTSVLCLIALVLLASSQAVNAAEDENWDARFGLPGISGTVNALAFAGDDLIAGGQFRVAGDVGANNIARWDGSDWHALDAGLQGSNVLPGMVNALAVDGSTIYAGGFFVASRTVNLAHVAYWDGAQWQSLGGGVNGNVRAIAVNGSDIYVGGDFSMAGSVNANHIARWDGANWHALGAGVDGNVHALAVSGSAIFVGGEFVNADATIVNHIARWDGADWHALGAGTSGGFGGTVNAIALDGSDIYVGGRFDTAGIVNVNYVAQWDGTNWHTLSGGVTSGAFETAVNALAFDGSDLYVGGRFTMAGSTSAQSLARWDGAQWTVVDSGIGGVSPFSIQVNALALQPNQLSVGGIFSSAGALAVKNIAQWNGAQWNIVANENHLGITALNPRAVHALAVAGDDVFVGGKFETAGTTQALNLARWDSGGTWTPIAAGVCAPSAPSCNFEINALVSHGTAVYAGGSFHAIGATFAENIAYWDGANWHALARGVNGPVYAIAIHGNNVYVGGQFSKAGRVRVNNLARWDGKGWHAVDGGVQGINASVRALLYRKRILYVGGTFSKAGKVDAQNIAQWDGTAWSALRGGVNGMVYALRAHANRIYVGGAFTKADNRRVNFVARWDGANWFGLNRGVNSVVRALAIQDDVVYVGGEFTKAGNVNANALARYDGTTWHALGSGVWLADGCDDCFGIPYALAIQNNTLYVGGEFDRAGNNVSYSIAAWTNIP